MIRSARAATAATGLLVVLCSFPSKGWADYLFVPYIGGAFAGKTAFLNLEQGAGSTQLILGGAVGWLGSGILGVEGDFAYAPRFFERDNQAGIITGSNALTASGSVLLAVPLAVSQYGLRPYAVGGLGLIHSGITYIPPTPPVGDNSLGFNVGAGAVGFLTERTGVRFELRHFRTFERQANEASFEVLQRLSFWRFTAGVVIRR